MVSGVFTCAVEVEDDGPGFVSAVVVVRGYINGIEAVLGTGCDVVVCPGTTVA